ncbi:MAG: amino acid ABC transporter permease [Actinomycetota bacterium]
MRRGWILRLAGALGGAAVMTLAAAAVYRAYGPGGWSDRLERFASRWSPFFSPELATDTWTFLGLGLVTSLAAAVISIALSLLFGTGLALLRLSRSRLMGFPAPRPLRWATAAPVTVLVQGVRSLPLFMLILYVFIAAPRLGLNLAAFGAGVFALTLYTSCVLAEIVRAGILSLDRGQFEAADALGLGYAAKLRFVVLPQSLRRMAPAVVSQLITLVKDTSLLYLITVTELFRRGTILQQAYFNPIETMVVMAMIYFVVNFSLSSVARRLARRPPRGAMGRIAGPIQGIGEEDQSMVAAYPATTR